MKLSFKFLSFFFVFHIQFYLELFFLQNNMNILHFKILLYFVHYEIIYKKII